MSHEWMYKPHMTRNQYWDRSRIDTFEAGVRYHAHIIVLGTLSEFEEPLLGWHQLLSSTP